MRIGRSGRTAANFTVLREHPTPGVTARCGPRGAKRPAGTVPSTATDLIAGGSLPCPGGYQSSRDRGSLTAFLLARAIEVLGELGTKDLGGVDGPRVYFRLKGSRFHTKRVFGRILTRPSRL